MTESQLPPGLNVVDIGSRLKLHETCHHFLAMLAIGPDLDKALRAVLPSLPKDQQRALLSLVAYRIMGAMLPAHMTLLQNLPPTRGLHDQTLAAAFQMMHEGGLIDVVTQGEAMCFYWPALERLVVSAIERANTTPIVGADGRPLA